MPGAGGRASAADLLLDGFAARAASGYLASAPLFRRAVAMLDAKDLRRQQDLGWLGLGIIVAADLWEITRPSTHWPFAGSSSLATMGR